MILRTHSLFSSERVFGITFVCTQTALGERKNAEKGAFEDEKTPIDVIYDR